MQSPSNVKDLSPGRNRYRRLCHLSLSGLLTASSALWAVPGSTTGGFVIPDVAAPAAPSPTKPVEATAPAAAPRLAAPPAARKPVSSPSPKLAAPTITRPAPVATQPTQIRQGLQKNSYIDAAPENTVTAPSSVVIKSRNNGCQTIVNGGSLQRGCGNAPVAPTARRSVTPTTAIAPRRQRLARQSPSPVQQRSPLKPVAISGGYQPAIGRSIGANQVFSLAPIANRGIEIALAPLPEYTRATNLYAPYGSPAQPQGTDLSFPVAGVNPITSAFGWRIHPISGQGRMHDGTDIGAPLGTPVVAAYPGTVAAAQWSGGYGLMVTLRHLDGTQESRYAHLSEMFVEPGQTVAQGEMIGRVGSTGFSTGPHLHFEWRHLTNDGWVAVDAGPHLQFALANLMRAQNYAQANADSQS
ncbi:MAG: peptidoglycan DD-metalloendopeptidase family protein [Synechocystis sp.]|nr:peptidoglycan DD-metalloendopeptidase family protein [Synechocystis sp.]